MNLATFMLKIPGKLKRKDDFKIVAIVAKRTFDTERYNSFVGFSKCLAKYENQKRIFVI